jgi:hypothetical protein
MFNNVHRNVTSVPSKLISCYISFWISHQTLYAVLLPSMRSEFPTHPTCLENIFKICLKNGTNREPLHYLFLLAS